MNTVLHLTGADQGGAERQLLALLREAVKHPKGEYRHVVVLVRDGELADEFAATVPTTRLAKRGGLDLRFILAFRRVIQEVRPAIVHTWGPTPNLWGSTVAATLPRRYRPRTLLAEVSLDEWKGPLLRLVDRLAYAAANRVVGCAVAVTEAAIRRGAPRRKSRTVMLGVAAPPYPERRPEIGLVLLLARLDPRKGHRALLEVWASVVEAVPHARLVMAGPAVTAAERNVLDEVLRTVSADSRLRETVTVRDRVDPDEYLALCEVLVVPSSSEGLPNVVLESFAHRVPVVANDVGGIREIVSTGSTGWLVRPEDPNGLARALVAALTDREEAQRRADAGRSEVESMTFTKSLRDWTAIYDEMVSGARRHRRPVLREVTA